MLKFKALNLEGKEVFGCGVLELESGDWILYLEKGYCVDVEEDDMGACLYEFVKKESIEIIR